MARTIVLCLLTLCLATCGAPSGPTPDAVATRIGVEEAAHATMTARAPTATPTRAPAPPPASTVQATQGALQDDVPTQPGPSPTPRSAAQLSDAIATAPGQVPAAGLEPEAASPTPQPAVPDDLASLTRAFGRALEQHGPFTPPSPDALAAGPRPGAADAQSLNAFVHLFPALLQAPAPTWLQEGIRVTYYGQSVSLAQAADDPSPGGAGFLQYDLVALDEQVAAASAKLYLDQGHGVLIPSLVMPSLGIPGAGDYWLHPGALRTAERVANDELTVLHMPTELAGRAYDAVRFQYNPPDAEYVWMFDAASGILLFYRHAIGEEGAAHRQLADLTLVRQREVGLPWRADSIPGWIRQGGYLRFEGTYAALAMGAPAGSFPYSVMAEVQGFYPRWSLYRVTDSLAGRVNGTSLRVSGVSQLSDALWLPAQALTALRDGQVLDRDPVTGAEIVVTRSWDGSVVLTESGTAYSTSLGYGGNDGVLQSIRQEVTTGAATTIITLDLTDRQ